MPSSVVANMHYDAKTSTLWITYVSGLIYAYKQVPVTEYEAMRHARSKGKYLTEHIKGKYPFEQKGSL